MQPAHFTAELPDTLAVDRMEQKSLFYWPPFMLGNAFPVETGIGVTHARSVVRKYTALCCRIASSDLFATSLLSGNSVGSKLLSSWKPATLRSYGSFAEP